MHLINDENGNMDMTMSMTMFTAMNTATAAAAVQRANVAEIVQRKW